MPAALLIQLLQLVPAGLQAAAELRSTFSETDQAALDAAIEAISGAELASYNQAIAALDAAAKT